MIRLFETLRIVTDELHTYRGVFGSHVANVIRRLLRICNFYGSAGFHLCLCYHCKSRGTWRKLIGRPVSIVDNNGAP